MIKNTLILLVSIFFTHYGFSSPNILIILADDLGWNNDYDIESECEEYCMETHLSCPNCNSFVVVRLPKRDNDEI